MKCSYCKKEIFGEDPFYFETGVFHIDCLPRAIRLSRKKAKLEKERREQKTLPRWSLNG